MNKTYTMGQGETLERRLPWLMLFLMSISSIVMIEPSPFDLLSLLALAVLAFKGLRIPRGMGLVLFYIGLFILGNIFSFVDVENFADALRYMAVSIFLFLIFLLFACLIYQDPQRMLPAFWKGYCIAALIASVTGILAYFGLLPNAEDFMRYGRAKSFFKDPNVYTPFLIAPIFYLGLRFTDTRGLARLLLGAAFMICVLGFLVGFSRGAIGNLAIAALIFFALKFSLKPTLTLFVKYVVYGSIMLLASVVFIIAALQTEKVGSMLEERAKLVQSYDTGSGGRFDIQKKTLVQGLSDPLGLGPGEEVLEFGIEPHNVYLYILSENGWLGLIGFSAFILAGIRIGITCLNRCRDISDEFLIIFTVTLATALQSLLIDSIHWRHLFVLNGVLWGFSLNALRSVALQTGYQKDSDPLMTNRNPA